MRLLRFAAAAIGIAALSLPGWPQSPLQGTDVDVSALNDNQDVPPVRSETLVFEDNISRQTLTLEDSTLFSLEVDDPTALYRISAEAKAPVSVVIEVSRITLNDAGQATDYDLLTKDVSRGFGDRVTEIPPHTFAPGTLYIGLAPLKPVEVTFTVERVPPEDIPDTASDEPAEAVRTGDDIAGRADGTRKCVIPARLRAGEPVDVQLFTAPKASVEMALYDSANDRTETRRGEGGAAISGLQARNGKICFEVDEEDETRGWRLLTQPSEYPENLTEPNVSEAADHLQTLPSDGEITAMLDADDADRYRLPELGEGKALMMALQSRDPARLCIALDEDTEECVSGRDLRYGPVRSGPQARLDLDHVSGPGGPYALALETVRVDPGSTVLEPNSRPGDLALRQGGFTVDGKLLPETDTDVIGFDPGTEAQLWRIMVLGETIDRLTVSNERGELAKTQRGQKTGRRLTTPDFYLEPGPTYLELKGGTGDYKILAKPLGPPRPDSEREPNDSRARSLAFGQSLVGTLDRSDRDRFSFYLPRDSRVSIQADAPAGAVMRSDITIADEASSLDYRRVKIEGKDWSRTVDLPAGEHILSLTPQTPSPAEYHLTVDYASPFKTPETTPVSMSVAPLPDIRAYSLFRQTISGEITLENTSATTLSVTLDAWFARPGIVLSVPPWVELAAGETRTVAFKATIAPDIYNGTLPFFLVAKGEDGRILGEARSGIDVSADAAPRNRSHALPAPATMVGGLNVALSALGAEWIEAEGYRIDPETGDYAQPNKASARNLPTLIDGYIVQGIAPFDDHRARLSYKAEATLYPVLKLPGDEAIPIVGVGINTRMANATAAIHAFAIDVSEDAKRWTEVLKAEHTVWGETAYYPVETGLAHARYVRLRALDRRGGDESAIALNAFEVIAAPGFSGLDGINIADTRLGAIVSGERDMRPDRRRQIDASSPKPVIFNTRHATNPTAFNQAIAFPKQRHAEVEAVEFVYPDEAGDAPFARRAIIYGSPSGPTGPWREIGRSDLPTAPDSGETARFDLPEWTKLQALKVEYAYPEGANSFQAPRLIRVIERPESRDYRSVLGLWGERATAKLPPDAPALKAVSPEGILASLSALAKSFMQALIPGGTRPPSGEAETGTAKAGQLEPGGAFREGLAAFETRRESWQVEMPSDANTLRIVTRGSPGFDPSVTVSDAAGQTLAPVETVASDFRDDTTRIYNAAPGSTLTIEVTEAQRSTVFLFDQSGSVASHIPAIRRAIIAYASDMVEGRDAVQFKALGGEWGSEDWFVDPEVLRTSIANYRGGSSSDAEGALIEAADLLTERDGSRAIVIVADGDSKPSAGLLDALDNARARVFVIKIPSGGSGQDPTRSQPAAFLWAGQTGGEMHYVLRGEDIAIAYARASARLLGPKPYSIRVETEKRVLSPGFLEVERADDMAAPTSSKLVILDASGSMLKRLASDRRINLAKTALDRFINEQAARAEAGRDIRVGLRVFGGPPKSCRTDLITPIARLDAGALKAAVQNVRPQNNAKTAIGAALKATGRDLSDAEGRRSILLITDGEETCGGDPLEAIEALRKQGVDTRLDVVSFALEPEVDRRPFEAWAAAGGGLYVDAETSEDLAGALRASAQTRFDVLKGGETVASGVAGAGPLELEVGTYDLLIEGSETTKPVTIRESETTHVSP